MVAVPVQDLGGSATMATSVFTRSLYANLKCAPQRTKAELLGLVQGILSDGVIVESEAAFLQKWIAENESMQTTWPANVLYARIGAMLADGVLDADEQRELLSTMLQFVECREISKAEAVEPGKLTAPSKATVHSPYDDPAPEIVHAGRRFVVTGDFACAKRADVHARIEQLGGEAVATVSGKTHYVVIGSLGSELWSGGNYGTKIQRAIELRQSGVAVRLVSEQHWYEAASRI